MEANGQLYGLQDSMVDAKVYDDAEQPDVNPEVPHSICFDHDGEPIAKDAINDSQGLAPDTTLMSVAFSKSDRVDVYWPRVNRYYPGTVSEIHAA